MRYIVDWHIHSKYSRACSKELELPTIARWCERKGIDIVATGDWTHPAWFAHIKSELEETSQGVYQLRRSATPLNPPLVRGGNRTRFMLVSEVSQIYKKGDKARRIHNLIFSPSIETCERVNSVLRDRGFNLKSDGRPILGIDSEELYKLLKEIDERIILVPAHAWTPWYAIFGSKSGFDSIEKCFGSMTPYIYAIETGLSSNPEMNWRLSQLDDVVCISSSDAHSPRNLGREASVFDLEAEPTYDEFIRILKEKDKTKFRYTIEFFPEEGKYHHDGCAACQFSCDPRKTKKIGGICPKCKRKLTLGVDYRVQQLADRESTSVAASKIPFKSIVPLAELIAESFSVGVASKRVQKEYSHLTDWTDEFTLLLDTPIEQIAGHVSNPLIAQAIGNVREGKVSATAGYDGVFGVVRALGKEGSKRAQQSSLI